MTISPQEPTQVPMNPSDNYDGYDGLASFDSSDLVTPRLKILHREGLFQDSLTNQTYQSLNLIVLGLVKQRILWPERQTTGDMPICKSNDHKTGFVNLALRDKPADKQFPWGKSNFDPSTLTLDPDGRLTLPCDSCELKEWGSHPDGNKPFCAEMFTLPVMYDPMSTGEYVPALISFQKTQLKPLRSYLSSFQRQGTPPFQVVTQVSLKIENANTQSPYSVPLFSMGPQSDPNEWRSYADHWRSMSNFLIVPPRKEEEKAVAPQPSNNQWGGQQAPTQDNPWGGQQAPGQPQWDQQPIQGQVNQQPVAQQPPAPVQQPVQQQPQFQQPPVQQPPVQPIQQQAPAPSVGTPAEQQYQPPAQQPVQQAPVVQAAPQEQLPQQPVAQQQPAAPPFEVNPTPEPVAQEAAAAPVTDAPAFVGGWSAQVGAAPEDAAPAEPEPTPAPVEQPAVEQPVAQQQPVQQSAPGAGKPLPF